MTADHYLSVLRRWALALVLVTAMAGQLGYLWASSSPPTYQADSKLLVGNLNQGQEGLRASSDLVGTYADLLVTDPFLQAAGRAVDMPPSAVKRAVTVTFNADTRLITISARTANPSVAPRIVSGLAAQLQQATDTDEMRPAGEVNVVAPAAAQGYPVPQDASIRALLAAVAAGSILVAVAVLMDRARPVLRDRRQAAEASGRAVLAELPVVAPRTLGEVPLVLPTPYRALAADLEASIPERGAVVLICGVDSGDDGRAVAAVLSATLAAAGHSTLLFDDWSGDRPSGSPSAYSWFDHAPDGAPAGLRVEVTDTGALSATSHRTLRWLREVTRRSQPGLTTGRARQVLESLRQEADVVVIAGGAVSTSGSALVWGGLADRVVLVARLGSDRVPAVQTSTQAMQRLCPGPVGLVLTTGRGLFGGLRSRHVPAPRRPTADESTQLSDARTPSSGGEE